MSLDRILCLANSYKHDHRCVAGISLVTKKWVRLIGNQVAGCLTAQETCYADGKEVGVLDVFETELGEKCGTKAHPEDVFVEKCCWNHVRRFDRPADLRALSGYLSKSPAALQSYGDRVYARKIQNAPLAKSLELIRPDDLYWWIREDNGKRRNRALFRLGHVSRMRYDLPVTDPRWLEQLNLLPLGIYPHSFFFNGNTPQVYLTLSLSELFDKFHYKLVAGVVNLSA